MFSSSWLISAQLTTRCPVGWYQSGHYTTSVDTADGNCFDCNQASATSRRCDRVVAHRPPRAACISSTSVDYLLIFQRQPAGRTSCATEGSFKSSRVDVKLEKCRLCMALVSYGPSSLGFSQHNTAHEPQLLEAAHIGAHLVVSSCMVRPVL